MPKRFPAVLASLFVALAACGARTELEGAAGAAPLDAVDASTVWVADGAAQGGASTDGRVVSGDGGAVRVDASTTRDGGVSAPDAAIRTDAGGRRDAAVTVPVDAGIDLASCVSCAMRECPQQATGCLSDPACVTDLQCAAQCFVGGGGGNGSFACVQACNIAPARFQTIVGLLQCLGQECQAECVAGLGG